MSKLTRVSLLGDIWSYLRRQKILRKHRGVAAYWSGVIDAYYAGKLLKYTVQAKQQFDTDKIIWQYWGQGFQDGNIPEIVSLCTASVDQHKGNYTVIRLDDESVKEYLDMPAFVWEKLDNMSDFNRTFFSDLLRVALLKVYGGVWLDATIFLSGSLPPHLEQHEYFLYQRDPDEPYKRYWESTYAYYWGWHPDFRVQVLNSIIFAKKGCEMTTVLLELMLYYWDTQEKIVDYFFFQILYQELVTGELLDKRCPIISDTIPHLLQSKLNGGCDFISYEEVFAKGNIHKMSYFREEVIVKFRDLIAKSIKSD
ncbi:capsular polysaccharide synthesis protein [Sphingobacterium gobiense]|uniref:Capsular biosynthesis protein n=1 Tax=Sphingobacterium gobiense TaxID=1382456 RepID=A0A2S9JT69_9SPHI|nr:capsular polysaccharide synthesis protein [Sphingobacterium gobiense]PRD56479.1 capsular biosynthesis protein [Sphingobacterium gobiense]